MAPLDAKHTVLDWIVALRAPALLVVGSYLGALSHSLTAVAALRQEHPARIVVAVPIAPPETCDALRRDADDVVCALTPEPFYAVSLWYEDFSETTDDEVHDLLEQARHELAPPPMPRR